MSGQETAFKVIQRLITNFKKDSESRHSLAYFQTRMEKLKAMWTKCEDQHEAACDRLKGSELDEYTNEYESLENIVMDYITLFQSKLNEYAVERPSSIPSDSIKLERVRIPSFTGSYADWFAFRDLFQTMVHHNAQLTNVQKLQYLRNSLRGEPEQLVNHLSITDENYESAWRLLVERYDNHRVIAQEMMQRLFNIESCTRNDPTGLRRMLDTMNQLLASIKTLKADSFSLTTIYMLNQKLDEDSRKEWQRHISDSSNIPTLNQFLEFLKQRFSMLEALSPGKPKPRPIKANTTQVKAKVSCVMCKAAHKLFECNMFKQASIQARRDVVKKGNLCFNCFGQHRANKCSSTHGCKVCGKKHNTLLHLSTMEPPQQPGTLTTVQGHGAYTNQNYVLLATAQMTICRPDGECLTFRALLDSGAQRSFVSEAAVSLLRAKRSHSKFKISGIGAVENVTSRGETKLCALVQSADGHPEELRFTPLILSTITAPLPCTQIPLIIPNELTIRDLADPRFNEPSTIDILIGADLYDKLLLPGLLPGQPCAQKTKLGWVLFGSVPCKQPTSLCAFVSFQGLEEALRQFWETEEIPLKNRLTQEERENENYYVQNVVRQSTGRYTVSLPFKDNADPAAEIGETVTDAYKQFRRLEHQLKRDPKIYEQYRLFMKEYIDLGHMKRVPASRVKMSTAYYLPHHAVIKENSSTTKLRVVFNASHQGPRAKSLNDLLHTGHPIQGNLLHLLMRWRQHRYVVAADIEKMYRQIAIHERDQHYQRILWRFNDNEPILHYQLSTVTYGTACAPYLAIRTLHQLATDEVNLYPEASRVLLRDFYVDDVLTGADNLGDLLQLQAELRNLLKRGGFNLRKWSANHPTLLERIPTEDRETQLPLNIAATGNIKTLGIQWHPATDEFSFTIARPNEHKASSKRSILAEIARLFDPIGWLQPCIIIGKATIRQLWLDNKDWDEELDEGTTKLWTKVREELPVLETLRIKRWIDFSPSHKIEIHGFCDASFTAYAAVIYLRVITPSATKVTFITAKSKVSPVNLRNISRLELNGAVLLAELMTEVTKAYNWTNVPRFYWCDSTTVLHWLQSPPIKWKVYVANRVSIIQEHSSIENWHYVASNDNPADIASRGVLPNELLNSTLWWKGPTWLSARLIRMPPPLQSTTQGEEERRIASLSANIEEEPSILTRFSSFNKLNRVIALCQRFAFNTRNPTLKRSGRLSLSEVQEAANQCIKMSQAHAFKTEIEELARTKDVHRSSPIKRLAPWMDSAGILRVGGRIHFARTTETAKHPAIIAKGHFSKLLIRQAHQQTLHGGFHLTLNTLRLKYWIISGQTQVKKVLRECMTCFKMTARPRTQFMGNLPAARVQLTKPFFQTGIDYAGPITIKWSGGRGSKTTKAYIAIFVCMATKAVHLELVSDLTTSACIAAIKRFVARRGKCQTIFSDCGSNFLGANKQLQAIYKASLQACSSEVANHGIQWKFIPPSSPHFGGLWEAGVKSMKSHLYKTIGSQILNIEEMNTLLAQIEACMNSRPLTQISDDPSDDAALTPGHFLTGDNLFEIKDDPCEANCTLLRRWQLVQQMKQSFWKRWSEGYLQRLQQRSKWLEKQENPRVGELVLVKTDNVPSMQWPLAKIVATHPGEDGLVRTVSVKMNGSVKKRPIVKICKLPFNDTEPHPPKVSAINVQTNAKPVKRPKPEVIDTQERKRKPAKMLPSLSTVLLSTLLILGVLPNPTVAEATIRRLDGGLYIEEIGKSNIIRGALQLTIELPFSDLATDENNLHNLNTSLHSLCSQSSQAGSVHCLDLVHHISELIDATQHKIEVIRFAHGRVKRGIFGQMLTAVFGVNDEIITDVHTLSSNQETLKNLINHQGKIILQATKTLNTTSSKINRQLQRFSDQLRKGLEQINDSKKWFSKVDANQIRIQFLATYQRAVNYIEEVSAKYSNILKAVNTKEGILECIQLANLQSTIQNTQSFLPAHLTILHSAASKLVTDSNTTCLKIHGYLPIIDNRRFDLIKATVIPLQQNRTLFATFTIVNSIIGINYNDQVYFETSSTDLARAPELTSGVYLLSSTILVDLKAKPNCVIRELYNLHNQPTCPQTFFYTNSLIFQQLMSINTWLFVTPQPVHAQTLCRGQRTDILINGTGLIKLTQDCQLQAEGFILVADQSQITRSFRTFISPTVPDIPTIRPSTDIRLLNVSTVIGTEEFFSSIITAQQSLVTDLENTQWGTIRHHQTLSTVSISLSGIILTSVIVTIIYQYIRRSTRRVSKTSQPSTSSTWYDEHRLLFSSEPAIQKHAFNAKDIEEFNATKPQFIDDIMSYVNRFDTTIAAAWLKRALEYNIVEKKPFRGALTVHAYKALANDSLLTPDHLEKVRFVAWCSKSIEASVISADDVTDDTTRRNGFPTWHTLPEVKLQFVNDIMMYLMVIFPPVIERFSKEEYFPRLVETLSENGFTTFLGQTMDFLICQQSITKHTKIMSDHASALKTYGFGCFMPFRLALNLSGYKDPDIYEEIRKICFEIGRYWTMRNDFLDCYTDSIDIGRTDIKCNKATWLSLKAMEVANSDQRKILIDCYGKNDPNKVDRIKALFLEMGIDKQWAEAEHEYYKSIKNMIGDMKYDNIKPVLYTFCEYVKKLD